MLSLEMLGELRAVKKLRHEVLLPWVLSGTPFLLGLQGRRSRVADVVWRCVTVFGNELVYLVALPYLFWNVSVHLTFQLVMLWSVGFYAGNSLKNILRLPRPPSPPIDRMEKDYENEYGLPSTHAMNALTLPITIVLSLHWDGFANGEYETLVMPILAALISTGLISFSRLYLGVHSPADIWSGLLLGLVLLVAWFCTGLAEATEAVASSGSPCMPLLFVAWTLDSLWAYPGRSMGSPSFNDVAAINSTTCGIFVGGWQLGWQPLSHGQFSAGPPSTVIARSLVGYLGLVAGKLFLKWFLTWVATGVFGVTFPRPAQEATRIDQSLAQKDLCSNQPLSRSQEVALFAVKFFSYLYLGYFAVMGTVTLFPLLGVD